MKKLLLTVPERVVRRPWGVLVVGFTLCLCSGVVHRCPKCSSRRKGSLSWFLCKFYFVHFLPCALGKGGRSCKRSRRARGTVTRYWSILWHQRNTWGQVRHTPVPTKPKRTESNLNLVAKKGAPRVHCCIVSSLRSLMQENKSWLKARLRVSPREYALAGAHSRRKHDYYVCPYTSTRRLAHTLVQSLMILILFFSHSKKVVLSPCLEIFQS